MRRALAEVEAQRDDAIAYLSAIRTVLGVVAQGHGLEASAQEVTRALVQQLGVETCAVVLPTASQSLAVVAAAAQADRLGGTPGGPGEAECLALVRLVDAEGSPTCFRRGADGAFTAVAPAELAGEGCAVLPLVVGAAGRGALVLYWLGGLGQSFGRAHGLGLVADIVGQALTVARARDTTARLCQTLADELGAARTLAETHQRSLSTREAEVEALTAALVRSGRVKEEFLGTVSHELRTPLNAILGYASLLREGMAGPITGEQASLVDRLIASTRNLTALIEDMLFFIQVEVVATSPSTSNWLEYRRNRISDIWSSGSFAMSVITITRGRAT